MIPQALASKIRQVATDHNLRIPCGEGCRHPSQSGFRPPLLFEHILWRHNQMPFNWKCTKPGCPAEFFGTIDAVCHAKDAKDGHTIASTDLQPVINNFFKSDSKEASKWQWEHGYYMLGEMMTKYVIEQLIQEGYLQIGPLCQPKASPQMVPFPSTSQSSMFAGLSGMARMEAFEMESHQRIERDTQSSLRSAIMMSDGTGKGIDNRQFNSSQGMSNSLNHDPLRAGGYSPRTGGYSPRTGGYSPRTPMFDHAGSSPRFERDYGKEDDFEKEGSFRNLRNIDGIRRSEEGRDRGNRFDDSSRFEDTPNRHNAVSRERGRGGRGRGRGGFDQARGTPGRFDNSRGSYSSRRGSFSTIARGDSSTKRPYNDPMAKATPIRDKRARSWSGSDSGREDGELGSLDSNKRSKKPESKSMPTYGAPKRQRSWSRSDEDSPVKPTNEMQKIATSLEEVKKEAVKENRRRRERSYSRSDSD